MRKSAILQEAVSTINTLKRERDELRRDRDRLQQEVSKLATCLQYSHLGSVAAASAAAMIQQPNQQFLHRSPSAQHAAAVSSGLEAVAVHTHSLNVPCNPVCMQGLLRLCVLISHFCFLWCSMCAGRKLLSS